MKARIIVVTGLFLMVVTAAGARQRCSVKDFKGVYAFQGSGSEVRDPSAPTPIALSGVLRPDGKGGFAYWMNVVSFVPPGGSAKTVIRSDLVDNARQAGSTLRYEVDANCRMRIHGVLQTPFGPSPLEIEGGLSDGGRRALMQLGSPIAIGSWTAEKVRGGRSR